VRDHELVFPEGVVFAFKGDLVTAYVGATEAQDDFGPADLAPADEPAVVFFSADGLLLDAEPDDDGSVRLSSVEDRREDLLARLTRAFTEAGMAGPEDDLAGPAAYGRVLLREQAVVNERNLNQALEPVLAELFRFYPGLLQVEPAPFGVWLKDAVGGGSGIDYRSVDEDIVWSTYWVADAVQEAAIEALWALRETPTWPECSLHPGTHPLNVELTEDRQVVWICSANTAVIAAVGDLTPNDS